MSVLLVYIQTICFDLNNKKEKIFILISFVFSLLFCSSLFYFVIRMNHLGCLKLFLKRLHYIWRRVSTSSVRSDHDIGFENGELKMFYESHGIHYNFFSSRTPKYNEVMERNNITLEEMVRTMLYENSLPKHLWSKTINTTCYV